MFNPYEIDLGGELYDALYDDPKRPDDYTVNEWAKLILAAWLVTGKVIKEEEPWQPILKPRL